ncbi:Clavaminate synthase-like protein [Amylostereum chailletii]|nr:Clavaminate synthase-like protein [Amylostereum chailletii]
MSDASLPPFPDDVPTVPLLVVDYALIKQRDQLETDRLWKAATELGFWYLKNHGAEEETDGMFAMGAETMDLPLEEKMKFEQGDSGVSFGYKAKGTVATDANGSKDGVEFINVAKDDALSWPKVTHRTYPSTVEARMKSTITPFVRKSVEINTTLIDVFNDKLGLPKGTLVEKHTLYDPSGSEARCIKSLASDDLPQDNPSIGAHTDFGSLSFLHHRTIGGLQVQPPGTQGWKYVKPIPGHAICNIGDALTVLSGGILRSNLHRVIFPPKAQAACERWSLVFFTRPGNDVPLEPLSAQSAMIAGAASKGKYDTQSTAGEWFSRRVKNQRINNRKASKPIMSIPQGPETWWASRGTEHTGNAVAVY